MEAYQFGDRHNIFIGESQGHEALAGHLRAFDIMHVKSGALAFNESTGRRLTNVMEQRR